MCSTTSLAPVLDVACNPEPAFASLKAAPFANEFVISLRMSLLLFPKTSPFPEPELEKELELEYDDAEAELEPENKICHKFSKTVNG